MDTPKPEKIDAADANLDDDEELELEPPDETIGQRQQEIALEAIRTRIDIDQIYREVERDVGAEILNNWFGGVRRLRFQVKHLLIATAVLAIVLTLIRLELFGTSLVVLSMIVVVGLYSYIRWQEQKHEAEVARQREKLYALRRARMAANLAPLAAPVDETIEPVAPESPAQSEPKWPVSIKEQLFRLQFSMRQLLILVTASAVVLAMIRAFGGPAAAASVLGLVALFGLVVFACGYEPPQVLILSWWLILAMYVLTILIGVVWTAMV